LRTFHHARAHFYTRRAVCSAQDGGPISPSGPFLPTSLQPPAEDSGLRGQPAAAAPSDAATSAYRTPANLATCLESQAGRGNASADRRPHRQDQRLVTGRLLALHSLNVMHDSHAETSASRRAAIRILQRVALQAIKQPAAGSRPAMRASA